LENNKYSYGRKDSDMTPQYQHYLSEMKRLKATPPFMSERDVLEALGIQQEDEYVSFLARKSSSHKRITPSLENYNSSKPSSKPQLKINLLDKVLVEKIKTASAKVRKERKKEVVKRAPRANSLAHLTPDEKRAYHSKKRLELYHKTKVLKPKVLLTEEEKKLKKSEYSKSYIQKIKEAGKKRKPLTDEQKEASKLWKTNDRRKRGILPRTKMSDEARKQAKKEQAERYREKMKAEGRKRIYTEEQRKRYAETQRIRDQQKREGMVA
jgi:hypothetical protein